MRRHNLQTLRRMISAKAPAPAKVYVEVSGRFGSDDLRNAVHVEHRDLAVVIDAHGNYDGWLGSWERGAIEGTTAEVATRAAEMMGWE